MPDHPTLYAEHAALRGAAEVAERQVTHLGDVRRYLGDVCDRTEAFRGFLLPFAGTYADAVASACDGVGGGSAAAGRWAGATRDTASGLETTDLAVRQGLAAVLRLLPVEPRRVGAALGAGGSVCTGPGVTVGDPPEVGASPLPADDWSGWAPHFPSGLDALDRGGDLGVLAGQGVQSVLDGRDLVVTGAGLGDARTEVGSAADDLDRYDAFVAAAAS